jgi:hypothetical protein
MVWGELHHLELFYHGFRFIVPLRVRDMEVNGDPADVARLARRGTGILPISAKIISTARECPPADGCGYLAHGETVGLGWKKNLPTPAGAAAGISSGKDLPRKVLDFP